MNRRHFLIQTGLVMSVFTLFKGAVAAAADALKELKIKDADVVKDGDKVNVAQFCSNADAPSKTCPDRKKPERKDQFCHNCQFYTAKGLFKGKEVGACTLIPARYVGHHAWCQTWVKKA